MNSPTLNNTQLSTELLSLGKAQGLSAVGFASAQNFDSTYQDLIERKAKGYSSDMNFTYKNPSRSTSPTATLPSAHSMVIGAFSYRGYKNQIENPEQDTSVAMYAQDDYYEKLTACLKSIAERLRAEGYKAVVLVDDNALVDREAAFRAGLGWYGKNSNILIPQKGSYFVLGSVLTDADLSASFGEPVGDGCGACQKCIGHCPTGAIVEPGVIDAQKCLAWLLQKTGIFPKQYRQALGNRIYGCDDCQIVCPVNLKVSTSPIQMTPNVFENVFELLEKSDEQLLEKFGKWYIPNREPRYIRRNALIVLGNIGNPRKEKTKSVLMQYLKSTDAMLRAHAVWATKELGLDEMLEILDSECDEMVLEEL